LHSLTPAVDWSDVLIGPGGLLLVVGSELSQSLFHVYLCGLCPSVTTFSTDFSFQKLVLWNLFEFLAAEITISDILNPNLTK
jgi:fluoride ion exporter CrcB/FEX